MEWTLVSTSATESLYNHFNWGYNGDNNGYFSSGVFDQNNPSDLDDGVNDDYSYNCSVNVKMIANISRW